MMRINLLAFIIVFTFQGTFFSQKTDKLLDQHAYSKAISVLEREVEKDRDNQKARHQLAIALAKTGSQSASLYHYNQIIYSDSAFILDENDWNNVGQFNLAGGNVEDAHYAFNRIYKGAERMLIFENPKRNLYYKATNVSALNSTFSDFSPFTINEDLIFTSDRATSPYDMNKSSWSGNAYLSTFTFKGDKVSSYDSKFNDFYHIGPLSYAEEKQWMFLTKAFKDSKTEVNKTKIYYSKFEKGKWSKPEPIEILNSADFSSAHPVFIDEFQMLVFSSDQKGGLGGMDLYYSKYENGVFQKPVNFGEKINSRFNDVFPTYSNKTPNDIYFSSNGHIGYGGLDVFSFKWNGNQIEGKLQLLPKSINSSKDDFGLHLTSDTTGYISSNRIGGQGDDIYAVKKSNTVDISGFLLDRKDKPIAGKKIYLSNLSGLITDSIYSDKEGYFIFSKLPYESVSIKPEMEDNINLIIRKKYENAPVDEYNNVYIMSGKNEMVDSVSLSECMNITLVVESIDDMISRCIQYEDGSNAVRVSFAMKDSKGNFIEKVTTDKRGCIILRKLYEDTYLEILEEMQNNLEMRFLKQEDDKRVNITKGDGIIIVTSKDRCVVYEDGTEVKNYAFLVKDTIGIVIDTIYTDELGCFKLRRLYNQKTYLDLMDEDKNELGFRFKNKEDENNIEWQKKGNVIIIKTPTKCAIYSDGEIVSRKEITVKDDQGNILSKLMTDENGCFIMKKLNSEGYILELMSEEDVLLKVRLDDSEDNIVMFNKNGNETNSNLTGTIKVEGVKNFKYASLKVILYSEDGVEMKRTVVNNFGAFDFKKLSADNNLMMMIEDDQDLLIKAKKLQVNGEISEAKEFIANQKSNNVYLLNENKEKFQSTKIDENGKFSFDVNYSEYVPSNTKQEEKHFEEISNSVSKEDKVVAKNIYFEYGKWDLNLEAEKILDDLAKIMKSNPDLKVIINAHTDANGRTSKNLILSQNRANSVKVYLRSKGVKSSQMESHGYGETKLLNHCENDVECTDEEHAVNRRIEFEFKWKR